MADSAELAAGTIVIPSGPAAANGQFLLSRALVAEGGNSDAIADLNPSLDILQGYRL